MATVKNWMADAVAALNDHVAFDPAHGGYRVDPDLAVAIIEQHSPFKAGVAYMPVPRCDSCSYWAIKTKGYYADSHPCLLLSNDFCCSDDALAGAFDDGRVETRPSFGCVSHEPAAAIEALQTAMAEARNAGMQRMIDSFGGKDAK